MVFCAFAYLLWVFRDMKMLHGKRVCAGLCVLLQQSKGKFFYGNSKRKFFLSFGVSSLLTFVCLLAQYYIAKYSQRWMYTYNVRMHHQNASFLKVKKVSKPSTVRNQTDCVQLIDYFDASRFSFRFLFNFWLKNPIFSNQKFFFLLSTAIVSISSSLNAIKRSCIRWEK